MNFGAVSKSARSAKNGQFDLDGFQNSTEWCLAAAHLILGIQKAHQKYDKYKGNTVFVFDEAREREELIKFVLTPPATTEGFYTRGKKQPPLDQVIDVPYFADSRHATLLQAADLFAFLIRLYAELTGGLTDEKFNGERQRLKGWLDQMRPILMPDSVRWPIRSKDPCTNFFRSVAPPSLLRLTS